MKYLKSTKKYFPEILFLSLVTLCFLIYFVVYMTPSRVAWYREMRNQIIVFYQELKKVGR